MRTWSSWDFNVSLLPYSSGTQATTTAFSNFFYRLMHVFLFFHGPIKRHIKFNSPSSHRGSLRIMESELGSDPLHCHVTFWARFAHPGHVSHHSKSMRATVVCGLLPNCAVWGHRRGQGTWEKQSPSMCIYVFRIFIDVVFCGEAFYSKRKPQAPRQGGTAQLSCGRDSHRGALLCCVGLYFEGKIQGTSLAGMAECQN